MPHEAKSNLVFILYFPLSSNDASRLCLNCKILWAADEGRSIRIISIISFYAYMKDMRSNHKELQRVNKFLF